jgi:cytochrome P450
VVALLGDERLVVAEAPEAARVGTMAWLRGAVSRFVNGEAHAARRAEIEAIVGGFSAERLRRCAESRALELIEDAPPGASLEVMSRVGRAAPVEALALAMGLDEPTVVAEHVIAASPGFFAASSHQGTARSDAAVARLVPLCDTGGLEASVARIAIMMQACDATAGLLGCSLVRLKDGGHAAEQWPTFGVVGETARLDPPLGRMRRLAKDPLTEWGVPAGSTVILDVAAANRDSVAFPEPLRFDPERRGTPPILTFGWGVRPCPGALHAMGLAAGVVDAVRTTCRFLEGVEVEWEPPPLRVPRALHVTRRD